MNSALPLVMTRALFSSLLLFSFLSIANVCLGDQELASFTKAKKLFERITGTPILLEDPRLKQMAGLIEKHQDESAAFIAIHDPNFYQVTIKNMVAVMSNRVETPFVGLDDFQATFIGAIRDNLDARTLLTGNYLYRAVNINEAPSRRNNDHYRLVDQSGEDYSSVLFKDSQYRELRDHAGLLTTRGWAEHYRAGTNRSPVVYSFQEFLCSPLSSWKVANLTDRYIGQDVSRAPGKDPVLFRQLCATCHAGMDAMRGAFASFDFVNGSLLQLPDEITSKFSRNNNVYPQGHETRDDSFTNLIAQSQPTMGFDPLTTKGKGINDFGNMLAQSYAFKECMVARVFTATCNRPPDSSDATLLRNLALRFGKEGYSFKRLFSEVATSPSCLGGGGKTATAGIKNFRSLYYSLKKVLGVKPTPEIVENYKAIMARLPKDGRVTEMSSSVESAAQSLGGLFCKEFSKNNILTGAGGNDQNSLIDALSNRIFQRPPTDKETGISKKLLNSVSQQKDKVFLICTLMTSSVDFLGRK